jgi:hypothetical protein
MSWVDTNLNAAVNTTFASISILTPLLMATTGLFPSNLQACRLAVSGAGTKWYKSILAHSIHLKLNFHGSQGNLIAVGDLFNFLRYALIYSKDPFTGAIVQDALTVLNDWDWREIERVLYDRTEPLPSQAFDAAGDNVPQCGTLDVTIPFRKRFDCISTNAGGTTWDTQEGDIRFQFVSDSAVLPSPVLAGTVRLYYTELDQ